MRNFQPIQIAVNLLLIVVLAIQPVANCMASGSVGRDCGNGESSGSSSCGCCQAGGLEEGRSCCCCAPAAEGNAQDACCSSHEESSANGLSKAAEEASVMQVVSETFIPQPCLCGNRFPPLSDSSPRYPTCDHRDSLSVSIHIDWSDDESHRLRTKFWSSTHPPSTNRLSQMVLCIWRL
jgi:hypothetical protein